MGSEAAWCPLGSGSTLGGSRLAIFWGGSTSCSTSSARARCLRLSPDTVESARAGGAWDFLAGVFWAFLVSLLDIATGRLPDT